MDDPIDAVGRLYADYARTSSSASLSASSIPPRAPPSPSPSLRAAAGVSSDVARVFELWQRAKQELQRKTQEIAHLRAELGKPGAAHASASPARDALRNELVRTQHELHAARELVQAARAENDRWSQSYEVLSNELELVRKMQSSQRQAQRARDTTVEQLEAQVAELRRERETEARRTLQLEQALEDEAALREQRAKSAEEGIAALRHELAMAQAEREQAEQAQARASEEAVAKDALVRRLEMQVEDMRTAMQSEARRGARAQLQELQARLDHLQVDNTRLVELLKATSEYQRFAELLRDATDRDGLVYLPRGASVPEKHAAAGRGQPGSGSGSGRGGGRGGKRRGLSRHENCKATAGRWAAQERDALLTLEREYSAARSGLLLGDENAAGAGTAELDNWLPRKVLELGARFRERHLPSVSMDIVGDMLREMNRAWQQHATRVAKRLKERHKRHVAELERRVRQAVPYEEVMQRSKISRLEQSLRSMRRNADGSEASALDASSLGSEFGLRRLRESSELTVATCLGELEEVSARLRQAEADNSRLRTQIASGEAQLEPAARRVADDVAGMVEQAQRRMRDCMHRVATLNSGPPEDEDRPALVQRAYSAMMEDVELLLGRAAQRLAASVAAGNEGEAGASSDTAAAARSRIELLDLK